MEEEKKDRGEIHTPGFPYPGHFSYPPSVPEGEEEEIDLYELFQVLVRRKSAIIIIVLLGTFVGLCIALFSPNVYRSYAIIQPSEAPKYSGLSSLGALSSLGELAGISMPAATGTAEIITLLKAQQVREEMIKKYNLLPILFPDKWDPKKKDWKEPEKGISWFLKNLISLPRTLLSGLTEKIHKPPSTQNATNTNPYIPDIDDGLQRLKTLYSISQDRKLGTIKISADFYDPKLASWMVEILLQTLKDYITREAIITAEKNLEMLRKELPKVGDPILRQKLQNLMAKNIETKVMAKVNREFAFKILEYPRPSKKRYKPQRSLIVMVSFVSSLFLGIFLAFFQEYLSNIKEKRSKKEEIDS